MSFNPIFSVTRGIIVMINYFIIAKPFFFTAAMRKLFRISMYSCVLIVEVIIGPLNNIHTYIIIDFTIYFFGIDRYATFESDFGFII